MDINLFCEERAHGRGGAGGVRCKGSIFLERTSGGWKGTCLRCKQESLIIYCACGCGSIIRESVVKAEMRG